jgi:hypothetical protein
VIRSSNCHTPELPQVPAASNPHIVIISPPSLDALAGLSLLEQMFKASA